MGQQLEVNKSSYFKQKSCRKMLRKPKILLSFLLLQLIPTNALKETLLCNTDDIGIGKAAGRDVSPASVAASLGITAEDLSSVPSQISKCCSSSLSCYLKGGICLPSWLHIFFSCYEKDLCYSKRCTCFKPKENCNTLCKGTCGGVGTCREKCVYPEVSAPYNCGINAGCQCCVKNKPCPKTCSGGYCRKTCQKDEFDAGSCNKSKECGRCCTKSRSCGNTRCGLGGRGHCGELCLGRANVKNDISIGERYGCPKGCTCCEDWWVIDPIEAIRKSNNKEGPTVGAPIEGEE